MSLPLQTIATRLRGLEEVIIYKLLDRAQFRVNSAAYTPGQSQFVPREVQSLFELRLLYQESMDAQFGRYLIPEERPFYTGLPKPKRQRVPPQVGLHIQDLEVVNLTGKIRIAYLDLLPQLCIPGDDNQYGSAVEHDVICLQALARRIHYGAIFVAESKFQESPEKYLPMMQEQNEDGIMIALTRKEVETQILERIQKKVIAIQAHSDEESRSIISPEIVVNFFKDWIIPLTKEGEVRYLLQRKI